MLEDRLGSKRTVMVALVAMIINGLGFHSSTLHMFPQFFANKPVERLIGPGLCADDLNDDVLGRCLDALFAADVSALYQVMAEQVVAKLRIFIHADQLIPSMAIAQ